MKSDSLNDELSQKKLTLEAGLNLITVNEIEKTPEPQADYHFSISQVIEKYHSPPY